MNTDYVEIFKNLAERYIELLGTPEEIEESPVYNYIKNYGEKIYDEYAPDYKITPEIVYSDFLLDFEEDFPNHPRTLTWLKKWFKKWFKTMEKDIKEASKIHKYISNSLKEDIQKRYQYRLIVNPKENMIEVFDNLPSILTDYRGDAIYGFYDPSSFYIDFENRGAADKFARVHRDFKIKKDYDEILKESGEKEYSLFIFEDDFDYKNFENLRGFNDYSTEDSCYCTFYTEDDEKALSISKKEPSKKEVAILCKRHDYDNHEPIYIKEEGSTSWRRYGESQEKTEPKLREGYKAYDPDEWDSEDIELHKTIDWEARDYEEYEIEDDEFMGEVYFYGEGFHDTKKDIFHKFLRPNPIYPPYYAPIHYKKGDKEFTSVMYDGKRRGKYSIHDRKDTWVLYDLLSH